MSFQFGAVKTHPTETGMIGQYALHIECPWRIALAECAWRIPSNNLIVSGSGDWREPAERGDNSKALTELFQDYDEGSKSWVNISNKLVVQQVESDDYGGLDIHLSGGYRLQAFPHGRSGEAWRLFQPGTEGPHLAMDGGRLRR